jgi:hypothetical protein
MDTGLQRHHCRSIPTHYIPSKIINPVYTQCYPWPTVDIGRFKGNVDGEIPNDSAVGGEIIATSCLRQTIVQSGQDLPITTISKTISAIEIVIVFKCTAVNLPDALNDER